MIDPTTIVQTEAQPAAVIRFTIPRGQIQEVMGPAMQEVIGIATSQGIGPAGPIFSHHFIMSPDTFDFEVGVPASSSVQPEGRVYAGELPAAKVVRTFYTGPYEGLGQAWGEFMDVLAKEGHSLAGNFWERYVDGPHNTPDPAAYRTELNCPLSA